jgi:hypothetical protein
MTRFRVIVPAAAIVLGSIVGAAPARSVPVSAAASIGFEVPALVDAIHTNGEPDVAVDATNGQVFDSGPTGTGTQRSTWFGSVDGGHTFRLVTPCPLVPFPPPPPSPGSQGCPAPNALTGTIDAPGGGDTDINFDRSGKQYFADLYALVCLRTATTSDGGATVQQQVYPAGCSGVPGADRQWLAVWDPPSPPAAAYPGPFPLIYMEYNNLTSGAQWVKSTDGLTYTFAENGGPGSVTGYSPLGADGYPAIDQVTGKVFQAAGGTDASGNFNGNLLLNIGTPDAFGNLTFLDFPNADQTKLIPITKGLKESPETLFVVLSMDSKRNLFAAWAVGGSGKGTPPADRQVFVSAASAASGWTKWSPPVQVSDGSTATGDAVNVFPWIKAGGPGRADAVWYGSNLSVDPSAQVGQAWNVFMNQVVFPVDPMTGAVTGANPSTTLVRVSPHPMHFNDVCLLGVGCITTQGNRNLADFFVVTIDRTGAAEVVYDDTSNGLAQPGFTPTVVIVNNKPIQLVDHAGAGVITLARQSSGTGLLGTTVSGPSNAPVGGINDPPGDALFPVIGGKNVSGMDILGSSLNLSSDGKTLNVTTRVVDLAHPAATALAITGATFLQYITRWQMGNTIFYAGMANTAENEPSFYAGKAQSVDLCSVSACFPHVITYPEPGLGGSQEGGNIQCPAIPSVSSPCTVTVQVNVKDVGGPTATSLLEEVGSYAFAASHPQGVTTNPQAEADNVPLEIDGACCYNFQAAVANGPVPPCHEGDGDGDVSDGHGGRAHMHVDEDACEDADAESVQENDAGTGDSFQSTQVKGVTFNDALANVTILGTGTHNGSPVTFTLVAVNGLAGTGSFSLTLSDGYAVSGTLLAGSIQLQ